MIKQSKLSKICWALVYLVPLIFAFANLWQDTPANGSYFSTLFDVFGGLSLPYLKIELFQSSALVGLFFDPVSAQGLDMYLGYLVAVSLFRVVWKVLVYLPDVIGKFIDRWSL